MATEPNLNEEELDELRMLHLEHPVGSCFCALFIPALEDAWARRDNMRRAYELKIEDLAKETRRCSVLQKMLDAERRAVAELWHRIDPQQYPLPAEEPERCAVCEGVAQSGLIHNERSPYCSAAEEGTR